MSHVYVTMHSRAVLTACEVVPGKEYPTAELAIGAVAAADATSRPPSVRSKYAQSLY